MDINEALRKLELGPVGQHRRDEWLHDTLLIIGRDAVEMRLPHVAKTIVDFIRERKGKWNAPKLLSLIEKHTKYRYHAMF